MRMCVFKAVLGASSFLIVSATQVARADDPRNGGFFQFHYDYNDADDGTFTPSCVSVGGTTPNNGAKLISWSCKSSTAAQDQAWYWDLNDCFTVKYEDTGNTAQFCSIRNGLDSNKCLGISGGSRNAGTYAITWDCLGKTHYDQYWLFQPTGSDLYQIVNYNISSMGLGPVGEAHVGTACPPGPFSDCYVEEDYLGLTSQMITVSATAAQP